jgi:hypothetical protein
MDGVLERTDTEVLRQARQWPPILKPGINRPDR